MEACDTYVSGTRLIYLGSCFRARAVFEIYSFVFLSNTINKREFTPTIKENTKKINLNIVQQHFIFKIFCSSFDIEDFNVFKANIHFYAAFRSSSCWLQLLDTSHIWKSSL